VTQVLYILFCPVILHYILCQKQTGQCPCQPIKKGQYRHLTISAVNKFCPYYGLIFTASNTSTL